MHYVRNPGEWQDCRPSRRYTARIRPQDCLPVLSPKKEAGITPLGIPMVPDWDTLPARAIGAGQTTIGLGKRTEPAHHLS
jgi:hypothetical protein